MAIQRYALVLLMLLAALLPCAGHAQNGARRAAAPAIDQFYVSPQDRITPGTELTFTVEGTPKGKASVRISGIERGIVLEEVGRGVYEGSYTITNRDRLSAKTMLRAVLQVQGRNAVESMPLFSQAALSGNAPTPLPLETRPLPPAPSARKPVLLVIDRFAAVPAGRLEPGVELRFVLQGTPGAKASFHIEGVTRELPMREVRSGRYEGRYTIRQADRLPPNGGAIATLESHGQIARSRWNPLPQADARRSAIDTMPPVLRNLAPREGETVNGNLVLVSATFDDGNGVGIDPRSVRIMIDGNDVTRNATVTGLSFSFRADLQPGRHPVEVSVSDLAGHTVRQSWSFNVAEPLASGPLPLSIITPGNNAQLVGDAIEVRGRTLPDARVDVQALTNVFGVNQPVYDESLRADASGAFAFSFRPTMTAPGTRYDLIVNASRNDVQSQARLTLLHP